MDTLLFRKADNFHPALTLSASCYSDHRLHCPDRCMVQSSQRQTGKPDRLNLKMNGSYITGMNEME